MSDIDHELRSHLESLAASKRRWIDGPCTLDVADAWNRASAVRALFAQSAFGPGERLLLKARLARDLFDNVEWSDLADGETDGRLVINEEDTSNDDNRALFAYLQAFVPDAVAAVPPRFVKPLPRVGASPPEFEYYHRGADPDDINGREPILGFYDAWDQPIDYAMLARIEYRVRPDGLRGWTVTDRQPWLRSQGAKPRELDNLARLSGAAGDPVLVAYVQRKRLQSNWVTSGPLPAGMMRVEGGTRNGLLRTSSSSGTVFGQAVTFDEITGEFTKAEPANADEAARFAGWVVGRGADENYQFLPDFMGDR